MRREILQCLRETKQMLGAARLLGLGRQTLYNHVKVFGIVQSDWRGVRPVVERPCAPTAESLLLKELSQFIARYSCAGGAVVTPSARDSAESERSAP
jgi:hypothetical protein